MSDPKKVIKSLVKECLLEILSEGLLSNKSIKKEGTRTKNLVKETKKTANEINKKQVASNRNIDNIVNLATDDDMMRSILAETAKTTFVEQMKHESKFNKKSMIPEENIEYETINSEAGVDLDKMFSAAKNNWSQMAFSNKK